LVPCTNDAFKPYYQTQINKAIGNDSIAELSAYLGWLGRLGYLRVFNQKMLQELGSKGKLYPSCTMDIKTLYMNRYRKADMYADLPAEVRLSGHMHLRVEKFKIEPKDSDPFFDFLRANRLTARDITDDFYVQYAISCICKSGAPVLVADDNVIENLSEEIRALLLPNCVRTTSIEHWDDDIRIIIAIGTVYQIADSNLRVVAWGSLCDAACAAVDKEFGEMMFADRPAFTKLLRGRPIPTTKRNPKEGFELFYQASARVCALSPFIRFIVDNSLSISQVTDNEALQHGLQAISNGFKIEIPVNKPIERSIIDRFKLYVGIREYLKQQQSFMQELKILYPALQTVQDLLTLPFETLQQVDQLMRIDQQYSTKAT